MTANDAYNSGDDFADIEAALRGLTPRAPSARFHAAVAARLDRRANIIRAARSFFLGTGLLGAAACAVFALRAGSGGGMAETGGTSAAANAAPVADAAVAPVAGNAARVAAAAVPPAAATATVASGTGVAGATRESERVVRSVEPLGPRRAPDGGFFRPYRVRYQKAPALSPAPATRRPAGGSFAVPVKLGGASATADAPEEELHFVRLDLI